MAHTPGPWEEVLLIDPESEDDTWIIKSLTNTSACSIAEVFYRKADARLIAASPDLLAACKAAEKTLANLRQYLHLPTLLLPEEFEEYKAAQETVKSALAKAEPKE